MKKLFYSLFALFAVMFTACSSDDDNKSEMPQLSLEKSNYILASGTVDIKLIADAPAASDMSIPVTFFGRATEGTDFTTSAKEFILKAGETEAIITLTRIADSVGDDNLSLTVNLGKAPSGYTIGLMNYTTVTLLSKNGVIMSFANTSDILTLQSNYKVTLTNMSGSGYKVTEITHLNVEVDPSSTAVEGIHFEFTDGKRYVTIAKKKSNGTVSINFLKKESGKDKLVLRLSKRAGYAYGNNETITITLQGACNLDGAWAFKKISNLNYWKENMAADISTFPTGTSTDKITFKGNSYTEYTFIPSLNGSLKNYFGTSERKVTFENEVTKELWEESVAQRQSVPINVSVYTFPDINIKFSATASEVRPAIVSFRNITVEGEEILECTIDDFIPTDFLTDEWEGWMKDMAEDPAMLSNPIRIHFTRVK
ncbi:hypothetical protein AB9N12_07520 [Bacteroides sp. AN502(2024)]|uniref:hypothetical protein n=1 Tax=Bacteroides sp. AN502(2024) TaxID=3160599 RepID=UPI003512ED45